MRIFLPACLLALLAGCAATPTPRPLDTAGLSAVRNQTVAVTVRKPPDFAILVPSNAMFGALGGFSAVAEGNKMVAAGA